MEAPKRILKVNISSASSGMGGMDTKQPAEDGHSDGEVTDLFDFEEREDPCTKLCNDECHFFDTTRVAS